MAEVDLNYIARLLVRLQGSVDIMRREVARTADDMSMLKADQQGMKADIAALRGDILIVRTEIANMRQEVRAGFDALDDRLKPLEEIAND